MRTLNLRFIILLCLWLFASHYKVFAYDCIVNGFCFILDKENKEASVTYHYYSPEHRYQYAATKPEYFDDWYMGDVIVPEQIEYEGETYTVTALGKDCFAMQTSIASITLPSSIKTICEGAFRKSRIKAIALSENVTSIESGAFYQCTSLRSAKFNDKLESIGPSAFGGCTSLQSVQFGNGLKSIDYSVFEGCKSLIYFNLPNSLESIGEGAFYGCTSIFQLEIPASIKEIKERCFDGCTSLASVTIRDCNDNLTAYNEVQYDRSGSYTGTGLFKNLSNLLYSYIGREIVCTASQEKTYIAGIFQGNTSVKYIEIGSQVKTIQDGFCYGATSLLNVEIANGVEEIGSMAFSGCKNLTHVVLPSSVSKIGENAFNEGTTELSCYSAIPADLESEYSIKSVWTVHVIPSALEAYQTAEYWKEKEIVPDLGDYVKVNSVIFDKPSITIQETRSTKISANVLPINADIKSLAWNSSDETVATVDNGVVTALKAGQAIIKATTQDGSNTSATCHVTVTAQPRGIFDFTAPKTLSPSIEPAEDEDDAVNIKNKTFLNEDVRLQFSMGTRTSYSAKIWTIEGGSTELRTYAGATLTFMLPEKHHIKSIVIAGDKPSDFDCSSGILTDGIWTGDAQEVEFTCTSTTNITSITVYYDKPIIKTIEDKNASYVSIIGDYHDELRYTRNYSSVNWQSLYVPFSLNYDDWSDEFDVARINDIHQFDDNNDGNIDRTEIEVVLITSGATEPNMPYMIKPKAVGEKTIVLSDPTLYHTEENSFDVTSWNTKFNFTGTYHTISGTEMLSNGYYAMGGNGALVQAKSETSNLGAFRWYLNITDRNGNPKDVNEVKIMVAGFDDWGETGVYSMTNNKQTSSVVYDLNGRLVNGGIRSGIYVKNGKKYVVK